jgi:hypothetical protein
MNVPRPGIKEGTKKGPYNRASFYFTILFIVTTIYNSKLLTTAWAEGD